MNQRSICAALLAAACCVATPAHAATTKTLVAHEGWRGLLCCNDVPDCIGKYVCPDYCKKPLPCPCGPLPPGLSGGCGPKKWWSKCLPWRSCSESIDCGNAVHP